MTIPIRQNDADPTGFGFGSGSTTLYRTLPDDCYPLGSHFSTLFYKSEKKTVRKCGGWGRDENEENVLLL
jgi:hypothetical protein